MSKPWDRKTLEEKHVKHALGPLFSADVKSACNLAHCIAPILSRDTKGNPRQVKRRISIGS
jgi:hypothetical protein